MRHLRTDYDRFHEYGALINTRCIYFGAEHSDDTDIDKVSTQKLIKNLLFLDKINKKVITIYWNCLGGDWDKGMAIYDVIKSLRSPVKMIGIGMVASMGTIAMQACKYRYLTKNCHFMIHDGYEAHEGEAKTLEAWASFSKEAREIMYKIYYEKMRRKNHRTSYAQIEEMCSHDKILSPTEAVKLGLADKVI